MVPTVRRTAFLRKPPEVAAIRVPVFRPKTCSTKRGGCGQAFTPTRHMQAACSPSCALAFAGFSKARQLAKKVQDERRQTRAQLEALKTIPRLKKEAQQAFNAWVRMRDADQPCISCGAPPPDLSGMHAGRDAGHYRSTGSADHLRYIEDNCHAQCVKCNQWGAGMAVEYRMGLIARIGLHRVAALESNNQSAKWTREGLREIRDTYRARAAELRRQQKEAA